MQFPTISTLPYASLDYLVVVVIVVEPCLGSDTGGDKGGEGAHPSYKGRGSHFSGLSLIPFYHSLYRFNLHLVLKHRLHS
jgi:hypothetical protein